jgi:hypothetical protein
MNRRKFLSHLGATTLLSSIAAASPATAAPAPAYFTLAERHNRWFLITPEGRPFFSLGLNHIDSSPLRYPEAGDLWKAKYGNSTERWLKESVRPDLLAWGFNSVGWTQEVVESALPFVDALCFQDFKEPLAHLDHWHRTTKKLVLWADGAKNQPATDPATGRQFIRNEGHWYADALRGLRTNPGCVGAHLCGAYLRNTARNRGLRDQHEIPDQENLDLITAAHRETAAWASSFK